MFGRYFKENPVNCLEIEPFILKPWQNDSDIGDSAQSRIHFMHIINQTGFFSG